MRRYEDIKLKQGLSNPVIVALILLIVTIPVFAPESAISDGVAWLEANQDPYGLWGTEKKTPFRDATVVVEILNNLAADESAISNGLNAISAITTTSTDYLARKITAMASQSDAYVSPDLLDSLVNMQNDDGGWGYSKGYGSNVLETALALKALKLASDSNMASLGAGVSYLLSQQNGDGGWSFLSGDSSRVFYTAHAIIALALLADNYNVATQMQNGVDWLVTQIHGDGGFGTGGASNAYETGLALAAIAKVDTLSPAAINARNYLDTTQLANGSWNDDAYSTAMALYGIINYLGLQSRSVVLWPGVNLLGLPVEPLDTVTSSDLLSRIPACTEIKGWDRTSQSWLVGDFPIAMQDGFFAQVSEFGSMAVFGKLLGENQCTMLQQGLNIVSVPNENACYTGYSLINDIGDCVEAHQWNRLTQRWVSAIKITADTMLGYDFAVDPGNGYFVRVSAPGQWCTKACDTIPEPTLPDLLLTSDDILLDPNPVAVDSPVAIVAMMHNIGTDTAFAPTLDFYLGDPYAGGLYLGVRDDIPDIPPQSSTQYYYGFIFTFPWTFTDEIYVIADYFNAIQELDETNNSAHKTLQVVSGKLAPTGPFDGDDTRTLQAGGVDLHSLGGETSIGLQPYRRLIDAKHPPASVGAAEATVIDKVSVGSITSSSAIITWVTDELTYGWINYGPSKPPGYSAYEVNPGGELHLVELDNLPDTTTYYFEVVSDSITDNNDSVYYSFTTTAAGAGKPSVLYGRVLDTNSTPLSGVIVSVMLRRNGGSSSYPLTNTTSPDGVWLLNLGNLKSPTSSDVMTYQEGDTISISCEGGSAGTADTTVLLSASPQDVGITMLRGSCCRNRGNVDSVIGPTGPVDVADLTYLVAYLFQGGDPPLCEEEGNVDGLTGAGGPIDVADLTYLVNYLFRGGPPPPPCP